LDDVIIVQSVVRCAKCRNAQHPFDTFPAPRNFPIDGEVANLIQIC